MRSLINRRTRNDYNHSLALTLKHGFFLSIAHRDGWRVGFPLLGADGGLDLSELALVDHLLLLAPLPIEQLATDEALILHI